MASAKRSVLEPNVAELPRRLRYRMPAEWEKHQATFLAWPVHRTDWPGKRMAVQWVFAEIARRLAGSERVRLLIGSSSEESHARRVFERAHVDLEFVDFVRVRTNRSWTRDYLPQFLVRGSRATRQIGATKFRFNGWARYRDHELDDRAGQFVARTYADEWFRPRSADEPFVLEGGAIDVDGQGTLLTTRACFHGTRPRNRGLTEPDTESMLRDWLGIKRVIWLADGVAGDDTSGHVDDFARFVAPGIVVVADEPNRRDPNHAPLAAAHRTLAGARDARNRKLEVVRLPMPAPLYFDGERLPASYANFYIANGHVLVPTFNDPADTRALGILSELFPKRAVVGIHAVDLVLGLGTLHCSTQQMPA